MESVDNKSPLYSTDVDLIDKYLKSSKGERRLRYKELLAKFHRDNLLNDGELFLRSRKRRLVLLRGEFFYMLKNQLGYSFSEIGRMFSIDHTTVRHGYKLYEVTNGLGRKDTE